VAEPSEVHIREVRRTLAWVALLAALPVAAAAQVEGPRTASGCIDLSRASSTFSAEGRLTLRHFAGPPNYESIARGDADESAFILELAESVCLDDGGDFADPAERVRFVQVAANAEAVRRRLRAAVGRRVLVSGEAFAAHTGHHHAPLVLFADRVRVR
jgi:hypothetical protein